VHSIYLKTLAMAETDLEIAHMCAQGLES